MCVNVFKVGIFKQIETDLGKKLDKSIHEIMSLLQFFTVDAQISLFEAGGKFLSLTE